MICQGGIQLLEGSAGRIYTYFYFLIFLVIHTTIFEIISNLYIFCWFCRSRVVDSCRTGQLVIRQQSADIRSARFHFFISYHAPIRDLLMSAAGQTLWPRPSPMRPGGIARAQPNAFFAAKILSFICEDVNKRCSLKFGIVGVLMCSKRGKRVLRSKWVQIPSARSVNLGKCFPISRWSRKCQRWQNRERAPSRSHLRKHAWSVLA